MATKNVNRIIRVMRLLAVVQTYHHYTMMQLNRQLLQIDNNWQDAEHMSHWMPANLAGFRKTVLDIEKNILQIANKQICRDVKKKYLCPQI